MVVVASGKRFTLYDYMQGRALVSHTTAHPIGDIAVSSDGQLVLAALCKEPPKDTAPGAEQPSVAVPNRQAAGDSSNHCYLSVYRAQSGEVVQTFVCDAFKRADAMAIECRFTAGGSGEDRS
jgi:hypothetical protein